MKKEYDFSKMKRRPGKVKVFPEAAKGQINIRIDNMDIVFFKEEAYRLGIPYQTFICSVLHRYVTGELVDPKALDLTKLNVEKK